MKTEHNKKKKAKGAAQYPLFSPGQTKLRNKDGPLMAAGPPSLKK
jgi:hypothetical protein